jgi:FdhE protein
MGVNDWQKRIRRAEELEGQYAFAAELMRFYGQMAKVQAEIYWKIEDAKIVRNAAGGAVPFARPLDAGVLDSFADFLRVVEKSGPEKLSKSAKELRQERGRWLEVLASFWADPAMASEGAEQFFGRAYLQPFAAAIRERAKLKWDGPTAYACPFCKRKPGVGVLRPLGDGGQRLLLCSFCLGEWEFRRILCAGCGEGDPAKLPVYEAEELKHVRVNACDSCKTYLKTVDFTKSALGEAIVDEIAAVPLDLWAQERGYTKLQTNLLQM